MLKSFSILFFVSLIYANDTLLYYSYTSSGETIKHELVGATLYSCFPDSTILITSVDPNNIKLPNKKEKSKIYIPHRCYNQCCHHKNEFNHSCSQNQTNYEKAGEDIANVAIIYSQLSEEDKEAMLPIILITGLITILCCIM